MLGHLFLNAAKISMQAGIFILVILLIRLCFRQMPKNFICILWALAALRLLFPFQITSPFGLLPDTERVQEFSAVSPVQISPQISSEIFQLDTLNGALHAEKENTKDTGDTAFHVQNENMYDAADTSAALHLPQLLSALWLLVAAAFIGYGAVSYYRTKHMLREAVYDTGNIWYSDRISSPFVMGYIKPRIYIPYTVDREQLPFILAHERAHITHFDHIGKLIGYLLLSIYWFHPLIWVGYLLYCKDLELACDERVLTKLGSGERKAYSNALLVCSVSNKALLQNPLAFSETAIKERIKHILTYKKPGLFITAAALVIAVIAVVCFMTNAEPKETPSDETNTGSEISTESDPSASEEVPSEEDFWERYQAQMDAFPGDCTLCADQSLVTTLTLRDAICTPTVSSLTGETVYHWQDYGRQKTYPLEITDGVIQDVPAKVVTEEELLSYAFGEALLQMTYKAHPYGTKQYILRENGTVHVNLALEDAETFLALQYLTFTVSEDGQSAELTENGTGCYLLGINNPESLAAFRDAFTGEGHTLPETTSHLPWEWLVEANGESSKIPQLAAADVPQINDYLTDLSSFTGYNIRYPESGVMGGFLIAPKTENGRIYTEYRHHTEEDDFTFWTDDTDTVVRASHNGRELTPPDNLWISGLGMSTNYETPYLLDFNGDGTKEFMLYRFITGTGVFGADINIYRLDTGNMNDRLLFDTDVRALAENIRLSVTKLDREQTPTLTFKVSYQEQSAEGTSCFKEEEYPDMLAMDITLEELSSFFDYRAVQENDILDYDPERNVFYMELPIHANNTLVWHIVTVLYVDYVWDDARGMFVLDMDTVRFER